MKKIFVGAQKDLTKKADEILREMIEIFPDCIYDTVDTVGNHAVAIKQNYESEFIQRMKNRGVFKREFFTKLKEGDYMLSTRNISKLFIGSSKDLQVKIDEVLPILLKEFPECVYDTIDKASRPAKALKQEYIDELIRRMKNVGIRSRPQKEQKSPGESA